MATDHMSKFSGFQRLYKEGVKNGPDTAGRLITYAQKIISDIGYEGDIEWAPRAMTATEKAIPGDGFENLAIDSDGKVSGSLSLTIEDGIAVALPLSMNRSDLGPKAAHGWVATVGDSEPFEITSDDVRKSFLNAASAAIEKAVRKMTSFPKLG